MMQQFTGQGFSSTTIKKAEDERPLEDYGYTEQEELSFFISGRISWNLEDTITLGEYREASGDPTDTYPDIDGNDIEDLVTAAHKSGELYGREEYEHMGIHIGDFVWRIEIDEGSLTHNT